MKKHSNFFLSKVKHLLIVEIIRDMGYFFYNMITGFLLFFHKDHFVKNIRTLKWNKLDSYIMSQFLMAMLGATVLFVSIFELAQIFQSLRGLSETANLNYFYLSYLHTVPYWTFILQPFGFLFATVYVLSKLSSTREMIAMVSTGTSIYRLTFYMMLVSIVYYFGIVTVLMDKVVLASYQKSYIYNRLINEVNEDLDFKHLQDSKDFTVFGENNLLYIGKHYNATERYLEDITVIQYLAEEDIQEAPAFVAEDEDTAWIQSNRINLESMKNIRVQDKISFQKRIDAERMYWQEDVEAWAISNGTIRIISEGGKLFSQRKVTWEVDKNLKDPYWFFEENWYPIDAMTVDEGVRHIDKLKKSGRSFQDELTKFYAKDAYPLGLVFVVMIGIGIVNMASKKVSIPINSAISMALFVVYYLLYTSFLGLAGRGDVSAWWGGFGGSAIFGVLALIFYSRTTT